MIKTGQFVSILPEYCDEEGEELLKCRVISGEEEGKPRITIEFPLGMTINPTQIIPTKMVKVLT